MCTIFIYLQNNTVVWYKVICTNFTHASTKAQAYACVLAEEEGSLARAMNTVRKSGAGLLSPRPSSSTYRLNMHMPANSPSVTTPASRNPVMPMGTNSVAGAGSSRYTVFTPSAHGKTTSNTYRSPVARRPMVSVSNVITSPPAGATTPVGRAPGSSAGVNTRLVYVTGLVGLTTATIPAAGLAVVVTGPAVVARAVVARPVVVLRAVVRRAVVVRTVVVLPAVVALTVVALTVVVRAAVVARAVVGALVVAALVVRAAVVALAVVALTVVTLTVVAALVVARTVVGALVVGAAVVALAVVALTVVALTVVGLTVVGLTVVGLAVVARAVVGFAVVALTVVGWAVVARAVVG